MNCKFCARYPGEGVRCASCDPIPYTGILVDFQIKELIKMGVIEADESKVQPSSIDLHLGGQFFYEKPQGPYRELVVKSQGCHVGWRKELSNFIALEPGQPCLASVQEKVNLPNWITMELRITSTEGRDCVQHILSTWGDPGFDGRMTLELQNVSQHHTLILTEGDRICQAVFHAHLPCEKAYKGRYQGDEGTSPAKDVAP